MGFLIAIAVIVILIIAVVAWAIRVQNSLVRSDELCGNALSQIGVQQASRWDALTALADLTKGYSDQEYRTLTEVIRARQGIGPQSTAGQVEQQEDLIGQTLSRIMAVAEAYPDLKSNELYLNTMNSVKGYEENVRMGRMVYNDTVTKFNRQVRSFPDSIFAGIFGFHVRDYLQTDMNKAEMPSMIR